MRKTPSKPALNERLERPLNRNRVLLEHDLAIDDDGVGLDKDLARKLLGEDERAEVVDPVRRGLGEVLVERCSTTTKSAPVPTEGREGRTGGSSGVAGALANLDLEQELAHDLLALLENELLVDEGIRIDELARWGVNLLDRDKAVLHEPLGDAEASSAGIGQQGAEADGEKLTPYAPGRASASQGRTTPAIAEGLLVSVEQGKS